MFREENFGMRPQRLTTASFKVTEKERSILRQLVHRSGLSSLSAFMRNLIAEAVEKEGFPESLSSENPGVMPSALNSKGSFSDFDGNGSDDYKNSQADKHTALRRKISNDFND